MNKSMNIVLVTKVAIEYLAEAVPHALLLLFSILFKCKLSQQLMCQVWRLVTKNGLPKDTMMVLKRLGYGSTVI